MTRKINLRIPHILRGGFTLIELLIVIAIVSLLIAILVPVMSAARQRARMTTCQSNLRQIATAVQVYLDQSDGYFFQQVNANINFGGKQGVGSSAFGPNVSKPLNTFLNLDPVMAEGAPVFKCPADTGSAYCKPTFFDHYGNSYATNQFLIGQNQMAINPLDPCKPVLQKINQRLKKLRRSRISGESKLPLVGDGEWWGLYNRSENIYNSQGEYVPLEWHKKRFCVNIAFMDTHVELVRMRKGLAVTDNYCIVPFEDLASQMAQCQQEVPTP